MLRGLRGEQREAELAPIREPVKTIDQLMALRMMWRKCQ
jgi:hypothetical protein